MNTVDIIRKEARVEGFHRTLHRAWQRGYDKLGYEQMGTLVVSSDIFRRLLQEKGEKPEELIAYGLPVRQNGRLAPEVAYVEVKEET